MTSYVDEEAQAVLVSSKIENIIVFPTSAQIKRSAKIPIEMGKNQFILKDMPATIISGSIRIYSEDTSIEFYKVKTKLEPKEKLDIENFETKIKRLNQIEVELKSLKDQKEITNNFLNLIRNIETTKSKKNTELENKINYKNFDLLITFVLSTSEKYLKEILSYENKKIELEKEQSKLEEEVTFLNEKNLPAFLNIHFYAKSQTKKESNITIEYMVNNVSWYIKNRYVFSRANQTFNLEEYAMLAQNTGEIWPECNLLFATRSANEILELPTLSINKITDQNASESIEPAVINSDLILRDTYIRPDNLPPIQEIVVSNNYISKNTSIQNITKAFSFPNSRPDFVSFEFGTILNLESKQSYQNEQVENDFLEKEDRKKSISRGGGSHATESAADLNSNWLSTQQSKNGAWLHPSNSILQSNISTCFALLNFLGAGHTDRAGKYKTIVRNALTYLMANPPETEKIYDNALYTMILSEASGMGCMNESLKDIAVKSEKKLENLINNQYSKLKKDVTLNLFPEGIASLTFSVMALKSAALSGINVDKNTLEKLKKLCLLYASPKNPPEICAGILLCLQYTDFERSDPILKELEKKIIQNIPNHLNEGFNELLVYWSSLALFQQGGQSWKNWQESIFQLIITKMSKDGSIYANGKYGVYGTGGSSGYSNIDTTSILSSCLEIYYRYSSVMKGNDGGYRIVNAKPTEYANLNEQIPTHFQALNKFAIPNRQSYLPVLLSTTTIKAEVITELSPLLTSKAFDLLTFKNKLLRPILSGETEILINGKFIGSYISPRFAEEEIVTIPLGINDEVKITKQIDQEDASEKKNKIFKLKVSYVIENFSNNEFNIKLYEKTPYLRSIEIELKNIHLSENGIYDEENNAMTWVDKLEANKQKIISFSYDAIYPTKFKLSRSQR